MNTINKLLPCLNGGLTPEDIVNHFHAILYEYGYSDNVVTVEHVQDTAKAIVSMGSVNIVTLGDHKLSIYYNVIAHAHTLYLTRKGRAGYIASIRIAVTEHGKTTCTQVLDMHHVSRIIKLLHRRDKITSRPGLATI